MPLDPAACGNALAINRPRIEAARFSAGARRVVPVRRGPGLRPCGLAPRAPRASRPPRATRHQAFLALRGLRAPPVLRRSRSAGRTRARTAVPRRRESALARITDGTTHEQVVLEVARIHRGTNDPFPVVDHDLTSNHVAAARFPLGRWQLVPTRRASVSRRTRTPDRSRRAELSDRSAQGARRCSCRRGSSSHALGACSC